MQVANALPAKADKLVVRGRKPATRHDSSPLQQPDVAVSHPFFAPETYPRRVLLALGGRSPQVVTETLWALAVQRTPAFVPTEVHLVTTTVGRNEAMDELLDEDGRFHNFVADYQLQGKIRFTADHLHPVFSATGTQLADIRTEADNIAAADLITERIREFTADPNCALHVSISGGRNTLGFYLGYALSMFGRLQDRLSHVLVPWEFQDSEHFFYPPPSPGIIPVRGSKFKSTAEATVTLAEIPFVSLRHGIPDALLNGKASYSQTIAVIRRMLAPPGLRFDLKQRRIWCGETLVEMPPQLLAFYAWMAERRVTVVAHGGHVSWRDEGIFEGFLGTYRAIIGIDAQDYEDAVANLAGPRSTDEDRKRFFEEKKTRVNKWLSEVLGPGATPYLIAASGQRPKTRFGLMLPTNDILMGWSTNSSAVLE
jgi:CRISPR-associated protein (TIGR02584 family)